MKNRHVLGAGGALLASTAALSLAPAAMAAKLPKVAIRVEGAKKTLLRETLVQPNGRAVRRRGHICAGNTAMSAFNLATHGRWGGTWYSGLGWDLTSILGEKVVYTPKTQAYWELFVGNKQASAGLCSVKVTRGEHILLAAVSGSTPELPISVSAPRSARTGRPIRLTVRRYDAKGHAHPLGGAEIAVTGGHSNRTSLSTDRNGTSTLRVSRPGRYTVTVSRTGYIRDETTVIVRR